MNDALAFVVMCDREVVSYPVASFQVKETAQVYAGWMNRTAVSASYRVVDVLLNATTPAMRAERARVHYHAEAERQERMKHMRKDYSNWILSKKSPGN